MHGREQARHIYDVCVHSAKMEKTLTYGEILLSLGYKNCVLGHAIRYGLELVLVACGNLELPRPTTIVVDQATGKPALCGYAGSSWDKDAELVFRGARNNAPIWGYSSLRLRRCVMT